MPRIGSYRTQAPVAARGAKNGTSATGGATALSVAEIGRLFPPRDLDAYLALPRPARETFLAIYRLGRGMPYEGGQAALAAELAAALRTVKRNIAILLDAGFVVERRREAGQTAILFAHPVAAACSIAERAAPSRPRYARRSAPLPTAIALDADAVAVRCAQVRRSDGQPFVSTGSLVNLMAPTELDRVQYAVETNARICPDDELDGRLRQFFVARKSRERWLAVERFRLGFLTAMRRAERNDTGATQ